MGAPYGESAVASISGTYPELKAHKGRSRQGCAEGLVQGGQNRYKQLMSDHHPPELTPHASLPEIPVVLPGARGVVWIDTDGLIETLTPAAARDRLDHQPVLFCHRRWTASRLGMEAGGLGGINGLDVLELFAFVRPARFALPTADGLAAALGLEAARGAEDRAMLIATVARLLLEELTRYDPAHRRAAAGIATMMAQGGWSWAPVVLAALGAAMPQPGPPDSMAAAIWTRLDENPMSPPNAEPGAFAITTGEVETRLASMLGRKAEIRPGQKSYAASLVPAFATPGSDGETTLVLAEAGTGTGKTLGYLAPSTVWAETNKAPVWVSTYTRSLQHQVVEEMGRFYPDRDERDRKVVIRKGRENYLCLLNLEDALETARSNPRYAPALGLMARWAESNPEGDLTGSGFPAWLIDLLGHGPTMGLADRRGECIHSACRHYSKCFVEKSRLRSHDADIIVANHALVMITAAMAALVPGGDGGTSPTRYVFDEGHHVFDAADSAFATAFSGHETADLRRWIRGQEGQRKGRARGLKRRLEDILAGEPEALADLDAVMEAARILPATGWRQRLSDHAPDGPVESFLFQVRQIIHDRVSSPESLYNLECSVYPLDEEMSAMAIGLATAMQEMAKPLERLAARLGRMLANEADTLDSASRARLEGAARGLTRRAAGPLAAWRNLLTDIASGAANPGFVDWMEATRRNGEDFDIGIHRHYLDPTEPFSRVVLGSSHGAVITSATLTDRSDAASELPVDEDWQLADALTGATHLPRPALRAAVASPFDYASQTRVLVVTDLARDDPVQTAAAMAGLMKASGGGALGLFTAIRRLREVYPELASGLEAAGLPLYAQHVDAMNLQTLLQIFREDRSSCLLGTDAVRDGIDVPGEALQLIVFDRVPWPRPDMLYKARGEFFGRQRWSDRATRMKLRQAFGRLVRRGNDRGVFIMLDSRLPSRMLSAFPPGVPVRRCGLAEAIAETRDFLTPDQGETGAER